MGAVDPPLVTCPSDGLGFSVLNWQGAAQDSQRRVQAVAPHVSSRQRAVVSWRWILGS